MYNSNQVSQGIVRTHRTEIYLSPSIISKNNCQDLIECSSFCDQEPKTQTSSITIQIDDQNYQNNLKKSINKKSNYSLRRDHSIYFNQFFDDSNNFKPFISVSIGPRKAIIETMKSSGLSKMPKTVFVPPSTSVLISNCSSPTKERKKISMNINLNHEQSNLEKEKEQLSDQFILQQPLLNQSSNLPLLPIKSKLKTFKSKEIKNSIKSSLYEEEAYRKDLLKRQTHRLNYLKNKSEKLEEYLNLLRRDIQSLEKNRIIIERSPNDEVIISETEQIKAEIKKLKIDCCCLSYQVQMYSGEIPNSLVDPFPDENELSTSTLENLVDFSLPTLSSCHLEQNGPSDNILNPHNQKNYVHLSTYLGQNQPCECSSNDKIPKFLDEDQETNEESLKWTCLKCTFKNHPVMERCEMCEELRNSYPSTSISNLYYSNQLKHKYNHLSLKLPNELASNDTCYCCQINKN